MVFNSTPVSEKFKSLLSIAITAQKGAKNVTSYQVEKARSLGANDKEIHDTVLIAAAFCMFNRYLDGLATWTPHDRQIYINRAPMRAEEGYADLDFGK